MRKVETRENEIDRPACVVVVLFFIFDSFLYNFQKEKRGKSEIKETHYIRCIRRSRWWETRGRKKGFFFVALL